MSAQQVRATGGRLPVDRNPFIKEQGHGVGITMKKVCVCARICRLPFSNVFLALFCSKSLRKKA